MYRKPKISDYGDLVDLTACGSVGVLEDFTGIGEVVIDPVADVTVCVL